MEDGNETLVVETALNVWDSIFSEDCAMYNPADQDRPKHRQPVS